MKDIREEWFRFFRAIGNFLGDQRDRTVERAEGTVAGFGGVGQGVLGGDGANSGCYGWGVA